MILLETKTTRFFLKSGSASKSVVDHMVRMLKGKRGALYCGELEIVVLSKKKFLT